MSLKTWMQEFYPVPADKVSKKDALAHSLQKWEGLRKANLAKHKCNMTAAAVFNKTQCALCEVYDHCFRCPLYQDCSPGCDALGNHDDPEPMIAALEKAVKAQKPKRAAKGKGKK